MSIKTIPRTNRQAITGKDGIALERKYLYLLPETWKALNALVQSSQTNQSSVIAQLIAKAGKEISDDTAGK